MLSNKLFDCVNPIEPLKCKQCTNFEIHKLVDLKHHVETSHAVRELEEKFYECGNCSLETHSSYLFLRHKLCMCVRNENFKFEESVSEGTKNLFKFSLKEHLKKGHKCNENRLKKCKYCSYATNYLTNLKTHVLAKHTNPDKIEWFECGGCSYKSKLKSNLRTHIINKHYDEKRFECEICPFKSKTKQHLNIHIVRKHTDSDKIKWLHCQLCFYTAKTKNNLYNHISKKHSKKKFNCEKCEFESKCKQGLTSHIVNKHTGNKKVVWSYCELCSYKTKDSLRGHMKNRHNEEKPFKCEKCTFGAKSSSNLKKHILRKHTDPDEINWFNCELCSHRTKTKDNLKTHVSFKHDAEKRFKCKNCPFETKTKQQLKGHIVRKHTDLSRVRWLCCKLCTFKTKTEKYLEQHSKKVHSESTQP